MKMKAKSIIIEYEDASWLEWDVSSSSASYELNKDSTVLTIFTKRRGPDGEGYFAVPTRCFKGWRTINFCYETQK